MWFTNCALVIQCMYCIWTCNGINIYNCKRDSSSSTPIYNTHRTIIREAYECIPLCGCKMHCLRLATDAFPAITYSHIRQLIIHSPDIKLAMHGKCHIKHSLTSKMKKGYHVSIIYSKRIFFRKIETFSNIVLFVKTLYWLPARWASGFSGDHQQDHQCLCFPSCYNVIHVFFPSLFVFCWEYNYYYYYYYYYCYFVNQYLVG